MAQRARAKALKAHCPMRKLRIVLSLSLVAARLILGATLAAAAAGKARSISRRRIRSFATKLPRVLRGHARLVLVALGTIEVCLAIGMITHPTRSAAMVLLLLVSYSIFVGTRETADGCNCFGGHLEFGGRRGGLWRNGALAATALAVLVSPRRPAEHEDLISGVLLALLIISLAFALDRYLSLAAIRSETATATRSIQHASAGPHPAVQRDSLPSSLSMDLNVVPNPTQDREVTHDKRVFQWIVIGGICLLMLGLFRQVGLLLYDGEV